MLQCRSIIKKLGLNLTDVLYVTGNDNLLSYFYKNAKLFVYPSLYEGFGFPPLEAMSQNCPVVCSKAGSIPEVVGHAGEYFDPQDESSIHEALINVISSEDKARRLVEEGKKNLMKYSWERCAAKTLRVYESLLSN